MSEKQPACQAMTIRLDPPTLRWAQEFLGGHVEIVELLHGVQMLVNEDAHVLGLPVNHSATFYARVRQQGGLILPIRGNAVFLMHAARWG